MFDPTDGSQYLASFPNEFSWYLTSLDVNYIPYPVVLFSCLIGKLWYLQHIVLEIP